MITRRPRRVDPLGAVERKRVKPERHRPHDRASHIGLHLDRQKIRHLPLRLGGHEAPLSLDADTRRLDLRTSPVD